MYYHKIPYQLAIFDCLTSLLNNNRLPPKNMSQSSFILTLAPHIDTT